MEQKGILFVVSGFAGTGKSTVTQGMINKYDSYVLSVSATTRAPREGEEHGREYFFLEVDEFKEKIKNNQFLEYACYVENYYGTPKDWVEDRLNENKDVILEIEMQGALQIKEKVPECVLIFLLPPDFAELENRLRNRGTDSEEVIQKRLDRAREEVSFIEKYDYIVINENIEKSIDMVHNIVQSEKCLVSRNQDNIYQYIKDFHK